MQRLSNRSSDRANQRAVNDKAITQAFTALTDPDFDPDAAELLGSALAMAAGTGELAPADVDLSSAPRPSDEVARLRALRSFHILDTVAEPAFDRVTAIVARILDVPIALVSLIDDERQWFKSCVGLSGTSETSRDVAFCARAILAADVHVVNDATTDPRYSRNPLVVGPPYIRAYAGAPLTTSEGFRLGSLCAIDYRPRAFTPDQLAILTELAAVVVSEMERQRSMRDLARAEDALAERVQILEAILQSAGEGILVVDREGRTMVANPVARKLSGRDPAGTDHWTRPLPPGFPTSHGVFREDRETPFPQDELPLSRALHGESTDQVAIHIRNESYPEGIDLQCTGRPIRGADGEIHGGVITMNDVTALRSAQRRLAELAITDDLTGLPNRRALRDRLELLVSEAQRGRRFSVAIADIDYFKRINDTHGHAVGDEVLVAVAAALRGGVRRSDLVARVGGEEFCIVQSDVDPAMAEMLTERLRAAVAAIGVPVAVTASFGVCHSSLASASDAILAAADAALYRAKAGGRNRVVVAA